MRFNYCVPFGPKRSHKETRARSRSYWVSREFARAHIKEIKKYIYICKYVYYRVNVIKKKHTHTHDGVHTRGRAMWN